MVGDDVVVAGGRRANEYIVDRRPGRPSDWVRAASHRRRPAGHTPPLLIFERQLRRQPSGGMNEAADSSSVVVDY